MLVCHDMRYAAVLMRYLTSCTQSCYCPPMIWFWTPHMCERSWG